MSLANKSFSNNGLLFGYQLEQRIRLQHWKIAQKHFEGRSKSATKPLAAQINRNNAAKHSGITRFHFQKLREKEIP